MTKDRPRPSTTVGDLLAEAVERFEAAGLSYGHGTTHALDEAAWLTHHALELPPGDIGPILGMPLTASQARAIRALAAKRIRTRKPAAYLTHEAWLGPHRFYVDERVIVPRSYIFELLPGASSQEPGARKPDLSPGSWRLAPATILDLCTGSGCLAILAALAYPTAKVDAADLSEDALAVAKRNVADYKLGRRVRLVKSDLFSALAGRKYDLIVTNPPYVNAASMRALPEEYRREPAMALASGKDGLDHARAILREAHAHLAPRGLLVMEIGHNRKALERAFPDTPFHWPSTSGGRKFVFTLRREELPFQRRSPGG
ncbi:MAG TPA: 50S ribosomal protein L3 N(5)-glutamine methyltransferase [Usitatibacter sp.]|nr:50S ribosomal protein L3 N(5)-glutamine methyltransferase [Usitatibacter sp.]